MATVSFSVPIGQNPKFSRGLVKVALSSVAFFLGGEAALCADLDPARRFVLQGSGYRPILVFASGSPEFCNQVWAPSKTPEGHYLVAIRLAAVDFFVDLSPSVSLFPDLKKKAAELYDTVGWTYLPLDAGASESPMSPS
jgi:hypothetical protein